MWQSFTKVQIHYLRRLARGEIERCDSTCMNVRRCFEDNFAHLEGAGMWTTSFASSQAHYHGLALRIRADYSSDRKSCHCCVNCIEEYNLCAPGKCLVTLVAVLIVDSIQAAIIQVELFNTVADVIQQCTPCLRRWKYVIGKIEHTQLRTQLVDALE